MATIKIDPKDSWMYSYVSGGSNGFEAKIFTDGNGNILESTYSKEYRKRLKKEGKKEGKPKRVEKENDGDGCLMKIIKAPFKLIWWIIKNVLIIVSLGMLSSWLNSDE